MYAVGAIVKTQLIANHAEQLGLTETAP